MFEASKKAAWSWKRLTAVAAVPALFILALSLICLSTPHEAHAMYVLSNDGPVRVDELEGDVFLTDGSAGLVSRTTGSELTLTPGLTASVTHQGRTLSAVSQEETLAQLLERLDVHPSPLEMISVSFLGGEIVIAVDAEFVFYEQISTIAEHETVYRYDGSKPSWHEAVIQEGCDGEYTEIYEILYQDGQRTARQLIDVIDTEPMPTIIEKGTMDNFANNGDAVSSITTNEDGSGTITLENGQTVTFSSKRTMRGTAYTSGGSVGTRTASGTAVHVGVVAVDKSVLPLGTKVYVVSNDGYYNYGFAIAEDTGVRGNTIDLYMDTNRECIQFGVRECTVYILD
ncbi:MAG: G5 domain-containing protein [Oscillospiraceae bacterium]|nr:G5 domain-containing protein [Oscillospiraceae bacterium]